MSSINRATFKDIFGYVLKETATSIAQGGLTINFEPIINDGKKFEMEQTRLRMKVPRMKLKSGETLVLSHDTRPFLTKIETAMRLLQQEMDKNNPASSAVIDEAQLAGSFQR